MTKAEICLVVGSLLCVSTAYCQYSKQADTTLAAVKSLYESGSYISAELQARRMLEDQSLNDSTRIQFEKYVAFSLVAQGKNESAVDHFLNLLKIDTSFTLDPVLTSPKILGVFQDAKAQLAAQIRKTGPERSESHEDQVSPRDRIPDGPTFRAVVFPGWDQIYRGKSTKGYILLTAGGVAALSSIASELLRRKARNDYLSAGTPALASSKYNTYNFYYKTEIYSISAFVLFYLYSEIDSFVNLPPNFKADLSPQSPGAIVGFRIKF
ncbi:MAG TPA: hypothetical protein VIS48_05260 [Candidatus Kryptonia bacterium]